MAPPPSPEEVGSARKSTSEEFTHGGLHHDAAAARFRGKHRQLVGVAHVERHRRGQELLAEVRLQIGRVIADERIGGGVGLVEAVAGELVDQLEDVDGVGLA